MANTKTSRDVSNIRAHIDKCYAEIVAKPTHSEDDPHGVAVIVVAFGPTTTLKDLEEGIDSIKGNATVIGAKGVMIANIVVDLD